MKRRILHFLSRLFLIFHKIMLHFKLIVLPANYNAGNENILDLKKDKVWQKRSNFAGIHMDLAEQMNELRKNVLPFKNEWIGNKNFIYATLNSFGPGYEYIDAQVLHSMVRYYKPNRIIEVGSGVSTYCMLKAAELNSIEFGKSTEITCIEPYPFSPLLKMEDINLIKKKVQKVPFEIFNKLDENDLLFIDSSHTVKIGSDVNYLFLDVFPRLKKGVIIHIHDIYFPYDYQPNVLNTYFHRSETAFLRAFLAFNERFKIQLCMSYLHHNRKKELKQIFPKYNPIYTHKGLSLEEVNIKRHFPKSIYIKKII